MEFDTFNDCYLCRPRGLGPAESLGLLIVCGRGAIKFWKNKRVILRFRNQATIGGNQGLDRWPVVWDWPGNQRDSFQIVVMKNVGRAVSSQLLTLQDSKAKSLIWGFGEFRKKRGECFAYAVVDLSFLLAGETHKNPLKSVGTNKDFTCLIHISLKSRIGFKIRKFWDRLLFPWPRYTHTDSTAPLFGQLVSPRLVGGSKTSSHQGTNQSLTNSCGYFGLHLDPRTNCWCPSQRARGGGDGSRKQGDRMLIVYLLFVCVSPKSWVWWRHGGYSL